MASNTLQQLLGGRRNNYTLPTHQIAPGQFNPIVFNPVVLDFKEAPIEAIQQGMAQHEERMEKAYEKKTAVDVALGEIENKLHDDDKTRAWFKDYKQNIKDNIQSQIDNEDFGSAIRTAVGEAGRIASDSNLINVMKASENWQNNLDLIKQRINKGISSDTYDWYVKHNNFDINAVLDGETYKNVAPPADDLNIANLIKEGATLANQEKHSKTTGGNKTNADGTGSGGTHTKSVDLRITEDDIKTATLNLAQSSADYNPQVMQWYQIQMDKLDDLKNDYLLEPEGTEEYNRKKAKYDSYYKNLEAGNGQLISDPWELLNKNINNNPLIKQLSRDWWTTTDISNVDNHSTGTTPPGAVVNRGPLRSGMVPVGEGGSSYKVVMQNNQAEQAEKAASYAAGETINIMNETLGRK